MRLFTTRFTSLQSHGRPLRCIHHTEHVPTRGRADAARTRREPGADGLQIRFRRLRARTLGWGAASFTDRADSRPGPKEPKMVFGLFGPRYELGKGTVVAISGCKDEQTSGDALKISKYFELPPGVGMHGAGGACTNGLMRIFYAKDETKPLFGGTWGELLVELRKSLAQARNDAGKQVFSQVPQLTASYPLPLTDKFELLNRAASSPLKWELVGAVQPAGRALANAALEQVLAAKQGEKREVVLTQKEWDACGIKGLREDHFVKSGTAYYTPAAGAKRTRALLIGINYTASPGSQLRGSHNDVKLVKKFITQMGFSDTPQTMKVLLDDGDKATDDPTKKNIIAAFKWLVKDAQPGDSLFLHYSGHGSQVGVCVVITARKHALAMAV